ncbi:hypothetical protein C8R45DRAFT_907901 [Mycena sanguinolenta]|nr:hypothetical protein C8R45DRAFT_907901 [Mycena sanguinolenta]
MESTQSLRDRLADLDVQIATLEAERKIIRKKLNSVTYPILKLPFEVTSEIFFNSLPDIQDAHPIFDFSPERLPIPVLLTQVCRAWREIALNTPQIWATFFLRLDEVWLKDRLAKWLEKARSSPLSFILDRRSKNRPPPPTPLLGPILALAKQWQNVDLRLPHADFINPQFQSNVQGRLHSLEELRINTNNRSGTTIVTAFELAPRLRSVSLQGLSAAIILLPWRQLTHFSARRINGADCLHVLRSADSLVECKFDWIDGDMDERALLPQNFTLQALRVRGEIVSCDVLPILTLPSLRWLDHHDGGGPDYYEGFVDFLSRSRPPLSHLSLHDGVYSHVRHAVSFLASLAVLEISRLPVRKLLEFFEDLQTQDPSSFLPNLESIIVSVWQPFKNYWRMEDAPDVDYGYLTDALEFRRHRNSPGLRLQSFRMKWMHEEQTHGPDSSEDERINKLNLIPSADFRINVPRLHDLIVGGMCISVIAEVGEKTEVWV